MEFWGVEVKAGESVKVVPEEGSIIHVSQAALGEQKGKGKGLIPLRVKIEGKKLILGSLSAESIPHVTFDLVFHTEFELSHDSKDGSVYFLGYKGDVEDDEYPSDSEDESLDAEDELLPIDEEALKKLVPSTNGAKSDKKAKVAVKEPVKKLGADSSSDEDEDDDDDDSSDDDITPAIGEEDDSDDDSEDDDDDDDSSEEEAPKEVKGGKKRSAEAIPSLAKKAKVGTQPSKPAVVAKAPAFNKSKGQAQKFQANKAKKGGK